MYGNKSDLDAKTHSEIVDFLLLDPREVLTMEHPHALCHQPIAIEHIEYHICQLEIQYKLTRA